MTKLMKRLRAEKRLLAEMRAKADVKRGSNEHLYLGICNGRELLRRALNDESLDQGYRRTLESAVDALEKITLEELANIPGPEKTMLVYGMIAALQFEAKRLGGPA